MTTSAAPTDQLDSMNPNPSAILRRGVVPALELFSGAITDADVDVLMVPTFVGESGIETSLDVSVSEQVQVEVWKSLVEVGATGRAEEVVGLPSVPGIAAGRIVAVGLGDADAVTEDGLRAAAGAASRAVAAELPVTTGSTGATGATSVLSLLGVLGVGPVTEGHALGGYRYGSSTGTADTPLRILVATGDSAVTDPDSGADEVFAHACVVVEAVTFARDLVNAPANFLYPQSYATIIEHSATGAGLEVEVLDENDLAEQGFGAILGVGQGSQRPPRLVRVSYVPDGVDDPRHVALVGKGVTFDTGGISLKPAAKMDNMISDMGGSAAIVAAVIAASELELPVAVTATVPLAENMPDGVSLRPGDILRHYGGTTTEVLNTDAEGRLILGDALARACEDEPDFLVETATLTGAQVRALGDRMSAVMGTPSFRDRVADIGHVVGEEAWPMPLPAEIRRDITSDVADLRNISTKGWGGMAAAGHYLATFVTEGLPWVHIDVAGPAYNSGSARGYTPRRATGAPVRTIIAVLEDIALGETDGA